MTQTKAPAKVILFQAIFILALVANNVMAATLTSSVNKNKLGVNETLLLQVKYDEQIDSSQMNWGSLQTDFEILGVSPQSNSSVAVVNGEVTIDAKTRWIITLAPKRTGTLTIPAFSIGSASSQSISIEVAEDNTDQATTQPLSATINVDKQAAVVGEQVLVRIEISAQENVSNLNGSPLDLTDADVQPLEQQTLQRLQNGLARQVIILSYAVFPTVAGKLDIPMQTFTGIEGNSRSVFDTLARRGQQIVARTKSASIKVAAAQSKDQQSWFPADNVTIESSWSGNIRKAAVGEPITRTIKITAAGQRASVIPPLQQAVDSSNKGYKSYLDQPQIVDQSSADGITGVRIEAQAIVPSISGELKLPEQRLQWWSTRQQSWQQAILPAEILMVGNAAKTNTQVPDSDPPTGVALGDAPAAEENIAWVWKLATLMLGIVCLLQFWLISARKSTDNADSSDATPIDGTEKSAWAVLGKSLKAGDANTLRSDLIRWARAALPDQPALSLQNLPRFAEHSELADDLALQLTALDAQLYHNGDADSANSFDAEALTSLLLTLRQQLKSSEKRANSAQAGLAPLYPS